MYASKNASYFSGFSSNKEDIIQKTGFRLFDLQSMNILVN